MKNNSNKAKKTFPLEFEEELHKSLKIRAVEEGKTLHSLIIETLSAKVEEELTKYSVNANTKIEAEKK